MESVLRAPPCLQQVGVFCSELGDGHLWVPPPKARGLGARTLFITLPLISPRALLTSSWAVKLCVLVLYRHRVQAVEGCHKLHLWFLSVHPLPTAQVDHCQKHLEACGEWHLAVWIYLGQRELFLPQWAVQDWLKLLGTSKWGTWNRSLSEDFHAMRFTVYVWLQTSLARLTTNWHQILEIHHIWL